MDTSNLTLIIVWTVSILAATIILSIQLLQLVKALVDYRRSIKRSQPLEEEGYLPDGNSQAKHCNNHINKSLQPKCPALDGPYTQTAEHCCYSGRDNKENPAHPRILINKVEKQEQRYDQHNHKHHPTHQLVSCVARHTLLFPRLALYLMRKRVSTETKENRREKDLHQLLRALLPAGKREASQ